MTDHNSLSEKLESHIQTQVKSNDRIELALVKLAEQMATFMQFQTRAEERQDRQNEFKEETKKKLAEINIDIKGIREYELKPLVIAVEKNSLISKAVVGVSCLVIGAGLTFFMGS
jgi:(p)ppGpp synthase/HD superfamily hydrolase